MKFAVHFYTLMAFLFCMSAPAPAPAQDLKLPKGEYALGLVQQEAVSFEGVTESFAHCTSANSPCAPKWKAKVSIKLNGCLDLLGPVTAMLYQDSTQYQLRLTAINVANKASLTANCTSLPTKTIYVDLGLSSFDKSKEFLLIVLGTDARIP